MSAGIANPLASLTRAATAPETELAGPQASLESDPGRFSSLLGLLLEPEAPAATRISSAPLSAPVDEVPSFRSKREPAEIPAGGPIPTAGTAAGLAAVLSVPVPTALPEAAPQPAAPRPAQESRSALQVLPSSVRTGPDPETAGVGWAQDSGELWRAPAIPTAAEAGALSPVPAEAVGRALPHDVRIPRQARPEKADEVWSGSRSFEQTPPELVAWSSPALVGQPPAPLPALTGSPTLQATDAVALPEPAGMFPPGPVPGRIPPRRPAEAGSDAALWSGRPAEAGRLPDAALWSGRPTEAGRAPDAALWSGRPAIVAEAGVAQWGGGQPDQPTPGSAGLSAQSGGTQSNGVLWNWNKEAEPAGHPTWAAGGAPRLPAAEGLSQQARQEGGRPAGGAPAFELELARPAPRLPELTGRPQPAQVPATAGREAAGPVRASGEAPTAGVPQSVSEASAGQPSSGCAGIHAGEAPGEAAAERQGLARPQPAAALVGPRPEAGAVYPAAAREQAPAGRQSGAELSEVSGGSDPVRPEASGREPAGPVPQKRREAGAASPVQDQQAPRAPEVNTGSGGQAAPDQPGPNLTDARPEEAGRPPVRSTGLAGARTPAEPEKAAAARDLELRVPADGANDVSVHLREKAGRVHVSVRTPDEELTGTLRRDLTRLVHDLEEAGYRASSWSPGETVNAASAADGGGGESRAEAWGGDRSAGSGGHPGGDARQQERRRPAAWAEEFQRAAGDGQTREKEMEEWYRILAR